MVWDGEERRFSNRDHDTLIEVVQILKSHVGNFDKHVEDDKALTKDVKFHSKIIYVCMGGLGVLEIILRVVQHQ